MKRYEQLALSLREAIQQGRLQAGERLPSVRQASRQQGVSPATVFSAYALLEAEGLTETRPRSGVYVRESPRPARRAAPEPLASQPQPQVQTVDVADLVFEVLGQARSRELVPLGSAFPGPQLFPLQALARDLGRALRSLDPWRTVEDLAPGNAELRRQIALRYLGAGLAVDAEEIVVTSGAMDALNLSLELLTEPGDLVAIESPTFYGALQALQRRRLRAVEVATHPREGVDLDSLAAVLARHPIKACWFMTSFQNPTGALMPEARKRALVELLARHGVPLIEDDVYAELHHGLRRPPPAKAFDRAGLVLHCGSFSKSLAPGYRVGWVAGGRYAQALARRKLMSSLAAALPSQAALAEYLARGGYDRHLRQLRQTLAALQARALRTIERHFPPGTRVSRPEGGYFLWLELPPTVDALALHRLALSQQIGLAPGPLFSADGRFRHHLRLNVGHPDPRLETALRTLGQLARSLAAG